MIPKIYRNKHITEQENFTQLEYLKLETEAQKNAETEAKQNAEEEARSNDEANRIHITEQEYLKLEWGLDIPKENNKETTTPKSRPQSFMIQKFFETTNVLYEGNSKANNSIDLTFFETFG